MPDGEKAWNALSKKLSSDPLFSALGLDKASFSGGNELEYSSTVTVAGMSLALQGDMYFDPKAGDGAPWLSLIARTSASDGDLVSVGAMTARAAKLDVVVYKEGASYKTYARIIPNWADHNKAPIPSLMLSGSRKGLDYVLMGDTLELRDIAKAAAGVPALRQFAFDSLLQEGGMYRVSGKIGGKKVSVACKVPDCGSMELEGEGLRLSDFVAAAASLPMLERFALTAVRADDKTLEVSGTLNGKKAGIYMSIGEKDFYLKSDDIALSDLAQGAAGVPALARFSLDQVDFRKNDIMAEGKIGGKAVQVEFLAGGSSVKVTGDSLRLEDFLPEASSLSFAKNFSFRSFEHSAAASAVHGSVNGADAAVSVGKEPGTLTVTGDHLKLSDLMPGVPGIQSLDSLDFVSAEKTAASLTVTGRISGRNVTVTLAGGTTSVKGDGLKASDFIPELASVPLLKGLGCDSVSFSASAVSLGGSLGGKPVTLSRASGAEGISVTGPSLKVSDFIPEAAQIPFLNGFSMGRVQMAGSAVNVYGSVGGRDVEIADDPSSNNFSITGKALNLSDFFPEVKQIPGLSGFSFRGFTHTADGVQADGKVGSGDASVSKKSDGGGLSIKGSALKLSDFIPEVSGLSFLDKFSLSGLTWTDGSVDADGSVQGSNVSVVRDSAKKSFTISGAALQLIDLIPQAASVPFLGKFSLKDVNSAGGILTIAGRISGKDVTVKSGGAPGAFSVTGPDLSASDFLADAGSIPLLNEMKMPAFTAAGGKWTLSGTVNGGAVTVTRDSGAKSYTITGPGVKLQDIFPEAGSIPVLAQFTFDSLAYSPDLLVINGKVRGKRASVSRDHGSDSLEVSGDALTLADFVPAASKAPFLNGFSFDKLVRSTGKLEVDGSIGKIAVTVKSDEDAGSFEVRGDGLTLGLFVPEAGKLPALQKFSFVSLYYDPARITVSGKLGDKAVSVTASNSDSSFSITGDKLTLADFVPEAASVPFLGNFVFHSFTEDKSGVQVTGEIHGKKVSVSKGSGPAGTFTATGDGLAMSDMVPEAGALRAFDAMRLDKVLVSPAEVQVNGTLNNKQVKFVRTRGSSPAVTVTADGLTLGDLFAPLAGLPGINSVAVEKIALDGKSVEAQALLNGVTVDVVSHADAKSKGSYVAVFFDRLGAATFIPAAQGHVVNDIALEKALFVIQPAGVPARTVAAADLPGSLPGLVGWSGTGPMSLSEGINLSAWLNVAGSGGLAQAFKAAGLPANSRPLLRGTLPSSAFGAMGGKAAGAASSLPEADRKSMLSGLQLEVDMPVPALPALAGLVTVKSPVRLRIGGDAQAANSPWSRVPAPIASSRPKGDLDVSLQFGLDIKNSGISEKIDAIISLDKGSRSGYSLLALYEGVWKEPFGIKDFKLESGGFEFSLEGEKGGQKDAEFAFFATADIGSKKVSVTADLKEAEGKLSLNYFELDGQFGLGDFPGGKNIPNADKFELDMVKIAPQGIEAATKIAGRTAKAYLFDAGTGGAPNWIFAIEQKNFNITELVPPAKAIKPLAALSLPQAALILSEKGLIAPGRGGLGVIAKDMFDDIFGKTDVPLMIPSGISLLAAFDQKAMGELGKGLSRIGVNEEAIIMGSITGVFQGTPGVMLSLAMAQQGQAHGLPKKIMNYKGGVQPAFFIQWAGEDFDAGLRIPMIVKAGKDTLELAASLELQFTEEGVGIKVLGEMDGLWHQPFGIKGFALANLKMDVGIDDVGEVQFGLAGDQQYGHCGDPKSPDCVDINLAMSLKILLEDALPDGVAFAGQVNKLGIPALLEITEHLMGLPPGNLGKQPFPFLQINNALLAFATPGATDSQLGLVSEGFAFGGDFVFMGRELGKVKGAGGPMGLTLAGKIDDIDLDVLKFRNNDVDIAFSLNPHYIINSDIELLGAVQKIKLDIEPPDMEFDIIEKLGVFGDAGLTVKIEGFDLKTGSFDKSADISIIGAFKSTLVPWLKGEIAKGIDDLRASAKAKFEADNSALDEAQKKVDALDDKIKKLKAEDQKEKDRIDEVLESAKKRVQSLQDKFNSEDDKAHHCGSRWTHWACSPGWRVAATATNVLLDFAKEAFDEAEKIVASACDLDPRIAVVLGEKDMETAGLSVARAVVAVSEEVEDLVMKELDTGIRKGLDNLPLEIQQGIIIGDLRGMLLRNEPMVIDLKYKLVGQENRTYFAVKIPDNAENLEFDAVSFALLPAMGLDLLTEAMLKQVSPDAARWVHSHIAVSLAAAQENVRKQVEAEETRYKSVLESFENGTEKYRKAFEDQSDAHVAMVEKLEVSDLMPDSLQYANTYLAIGHSNLCLAVSKDGLSVQQVPCKDTDAEQWNTLALTDDAKGYVELRNKGLCLKARKGDDKDNYEPLILAPCDKNDYHQQWKIVSSDGFFDQIVNRFSQKCLHFNTENANPRTAFAVWTSCLGADSQTFRDIPDAEKPTRHEVNAMVKASNGLCLDVREKTENSLKLTPALKELKLYASPCGQGSERFNYMEEVDGDIQLVHTETGACIYPQEKAQSLALRACDRGQDMFWRLDAMESDRLQFKNTSRNLCMTLPAPPKGSTNYKEAGIAPCNASDGAMLLDLVK